ncbi:hypothetical protein KC19_1G046600 [Ceratodon purpureus]|uniref:Uncharacterized protein n=1 Tax=Ceratodon purpureus TaxID=3225 RepID=A0A8T0J2K1_CERPU|nr:hypothetical protein KC19_VG062900 [Ceratodon purpureus]KAG0589767.1 hypothetical protein KC19_1G046600 [Ceratodon purpureus]
MATALIVPKLTCRIDFRTPTSIDSSRPSSVIWAMPESYVTYAGHENLSVRKCAPYAHIEA